MTPAQLKSAVLKKLQKTAAGDTDAPDDVAILTEKYDALHAMLLDDELVIWSLTENIPKKAELPLIAMLAAFAANEFNVPDPRYSRLQIEGQFNLPANVGGPSLAERQLRKALSADYVSSPLVSEYF